MLHSSLLLPDLYSINQTQRIAAERTFNDSRSVSQQNSYSI